MVVTLEKKRGRQKSALLAESGSAYQRQFDLFVRSTDQKYKQIQQIKELMKTLPRRRSFLDIGAGSGEITKAISGYFEQVTIIEPNREQLPKLSELLPTAKIINGKIETTRLNGDFYDLILCSHVFYYIPESKWMSILRKMFSRLNHGGKLLVVLQSPEGGAPAFYKKFAGSSVNSIGLWSKLARTFGEFNVRAHYGIARIRTKTLEEMTSIGLFLLLDKRYRQQKGDIKKYFGSHHKALEGYQMDQEYITFEITK